ncbi:hypothetical protein R1flu_027095 [Riccia fluitans]|uniref:Uncharacterized protein n=1 Tax=Riccia fluitans TaxID=41844 RepID=A0ABD1XHW3_9MARC
MTIDPPISSFSIHWGCYSEFPVRSRVKSVLLLRDLWSMENKISHCQENDSKTHSKSIRRCGCNEMQSNVYCYGYGVGTLSTSRLSTANCKLLSGTYTQAYVEPFSKMRQWSTLSPHQLT